MEQLNRQALKIISKLLTFLQSREKSLDMVKAYDYVIGLIDLELRHKIKGPRIVEFKKRGWYVKEERP